MKKFDNHMEQQDNYFTELAKFETSVKEFETSIINKSKLEILSQQKYIEEEINYLSSPSGNSNVRISLIDSLDITQTRFLGDLELTETSSDQETPLLLINTETIAPSIACKSTTLCNLLPSLESNTSIAKCKKFISFVKKFMIFILVSYKIKENMPMKKLCAEDFNLP